MTHTRRSTFGQTLLTALCGFVVLVCVAAMLAALVLGLRPVVITTGSMGDAAPAGSLVIAGPKDVADIAVGDIVVMRRPDSAPVTHRVIEIQDELPRPRAITKGDANPSPDPIPYELTDGELVARWVLPSMGSVLDGVRDPRVAVAAMALLLAVGAIVALRRVWSEPGSSDDDRPDGPPPPPPSEPPSPPSSTTEGSTKAQIGAALSAVVLLVGASVVSALYSESLAVDANSFGTSTCFDPRLGSVQSGVTVHATSGVVAEPITAVDMSRSFVTATVRSASNEIADSSVRVRLSAADTLELRRVTDAGTPPSVTVSWAVVEYTCGVSVQRGIEPGDGTDRLDISISSVDVASSFVFVNALAPATAAEFGPSQLFVGELSASDTLTIRGESSAAFPVDQVFAWQVVTFDDPDRIDVQRVSSTLGVGLTSGTVTLPIAVDLDTTFLTVFVTTNASGPDVGERMVRAHLADPTTVTVERSVGGDAVEVHVQAVSLLDGTVVRHGTVDLASGTGTETVVVEPVDATRSTAMSTVATPGPVAGGLTDHVADDVVGEATATFEVSDPTTVTITRDATASNASFGWQVIEWTGPNWWDNAYGYRQRIDVDALTVAAPDAYTVPVTVDHAALISSGLAEPDGDDLRIVRWDGASWTELDRVLDDDSAWGQSDTTMWFRTTDPIAAGGSQTYWLHMSNPAAGPAPSDPEAVYLLTEDFDSGTLGDFEDRTGGTAWYAADPWTRRIPVTVPAGRVASDLAEFPLLVSLTDADLAANAQPDGSDIRFTAADGSTVLSHEVESFDAGTGALAAWVRVPLVATSAATTVYLYYGADDAPAQADVSGTWSPEFEAVWHLARDPDGSAPQIDDSSSRNHDGLAIGSMTGADLVDGRVGKGLDLDGSDDALAVDQLRLAAVDGLTISGWVRLDALASDARIFSKANSTVDRQVDLVVRTDGAVQARLLLDTGEVVASSAAAAVATGGWHHVAATWDGVRLDVVVDGTSRGSTTAWDPIVARPDMAVHLGNVASQDRGVDGILDEVRVETTARQIDWLAASEANQRTPATFLSVGGVEVGTWFDQGSWSYRKPVVVDSAQVPTDLLDFPLLVQFTDAAVQGSAQACGCDIVFTGADGTTRLDHAVEAYDSGTGALTAWVSVPVLSGSEDTELFLYYGNPAAVDQQDPPAVFGSDADLQMLGAP